MPYVGFYVSDGESRYNMSERSLGFRWFFSFLLFTAFKGHAVHRTIFLFDEPAANLHARAQAELLENFGKIATSGNRIVYSTHSHYMINPHWLSLAYIIDNKAIDYDSKNSFSLDARPTDVTAVKYRHFVSQYPTRTSYFQPVIEQLEYVVPSLLGQAPFLVFEGISDYYLFKIAQRLSADRFNNLAFVPGAGAGASGPLLSFLLGRAERFLIILDDDKAGRVAADRYKREWILSYREVVTLGDLCSIHSGKRLEGLISVASKKLIQTYLNLDRQAGKKEIGLYLAEAYSTNKVDAFTSDTIAALQDVLEAAQKQIATPTT